MISTTNPGTLPSPQPRADSGRGRGNFHNRGRGRGKGRGSNGRGRGSQHQYQHQGSFSQIRGPSSPWNTWQQQQYFQGNSWLVPSSQPPYGQRPQWAVPPCPHPTMPPAAPPRTSAPQAYTGILGPRPSSSYDNYGAGHTPTDIEQALYTMSLNPPDNNWYMDTGATSHMTNNSGTISSHFNNNTLNDITVGDSSRIPIHGSGHTILKSPFPPLKLNNILYSPHLIKNLLSVRRFTTDNQVSIEFDAFGFLVKDYRTQTPILRCNSTGDLYPLLPSSIQAVTPFSFSAISQQVWHQRLGHPRPDLLRRLNRNNVIHCHTTSNIPCCHSCIFGKQIKMPFYDSIIYSFTI